MSRREVPTAESKGRRAVFAIWIVLTIVAALYVGIVGPFAGVLGTDTWLVGVIVPPLMIILAGFGIAWIVALARKAPDGAHRDATTSATPK